MNPVGYIWARTISGNPACEEFRVVNSLSIKKEKLRIQKYKVL
jgi:hypothetical protein